MNATMTLCAELIMMTLNEIPWMQLIRNMHTNHHLQYINMRNTLTLIGLSTVMHIV